MNEVLRPAAYLPQAFVRLPPNRREIFQYNRPQRSAALGLRSRSATRRVRFLRGRFAALLPRMSRFPVATCRSDYPIHILTHASRLCMRAADHRFVVTENGPELPQPRSLVRFRSTTTALPP
jgi:hypothetical protein